jgi:hypothetical protein
VAGRPDDPATERPTAATKPQPEGRRSPEARWPGGEGEGRPIRASSSTGASRGGRKTGQASRAKRRFRKEPKRRRTGGEETGNRPRLRTGGKPKADLGPLGRSGGSRARDWSPARVSRRGGAASAGPSRWAGKGNRFPLSGPPRVRRGFGFAATPGDGKGGGLSGRTRSDREAAGFLPGRDPRSPNAAARPRSGLRPPSG